MGLFGKKKTTSDIGSLWAAEPDEIANYESALNYLIGLSGDDYTKVTQVAAIHRQANYEAAKVLGMDDQPTTFITPPEPEMPADEPNFLDDEDIKPKSKSIKVK